MKKKANNIWKFAKNVYQKVSNENVRFEKINTIKNKRIKFNYKNLHQSKIRWQVTFNNVFLKKILVNKTKLWYLWQKIVNNRCFFETMKNICKKSIKTYDIYESQKFFAFYHDKTIQQTTNAIIEIIKTIQIHNSVYFKKKMTKQTR
jgi:hypothetical protein